MEKCLVRPTSMRCPFSHLTLLFSMAMAVKLLKILIMLIMLDNDSAYIIYGLSELFKMMNLVNIKELD